MSSGYEKRDVQVKPLMIAGIVILLIVIISSILMVIYYRSFDRSWNPKNPYAFEGTPTQTEAAPELILQINPVQDIKEMREQEMKQLTSYGWVDKESQTIRIPIEKAMEIIAKQGSASNAESEVGS